MWPWTKPKPDRDLAERLEKVERDMKALRADAEEWQERYARLNARIAKRIKDALKHDQEFLDAEPSHTNAPGSTNGRRITNPLAAEILRGRINQGG